MRAKSARTGFLQIAECDSALATDQNNKRRSRGLNPDCWTVAWTSRHYQLRWVLRHFSDKPTSMISRQLGLLPITRRSGSRPIRYLQPCRQARWKPAEVAILFSALTTCSDYR